MAVSYSGVRPGPGDDASAVGAVIGISVPCWYQFAKPMIEWIMSALLFLLAAPVMFVAMAAVLLTSRGPVIYAQVRLGRNAKRFMIFKIRTMHHRCETATGPVWSLPSGDPRVTPVGRFLRRTHIDELPQLWNVLRGEMSLVGPRPERPEFVCQLEKAIPRYRERMRVRPGITGLAQVQLPPDTTLDDVRRKLACDLYYVQRLSFWLDVQILLSTPSNLVGIPFEFTRTFLRVPSGETLDRGDTNLITSASQMEPA